MVEYLRPDADSSDGGWTDAGGGTTLFSSVDESSFNDSDYIKSGASPVNDAVKLRFSDAASVLIGGIVRYRLWKTGAEVMNAAVKLLQGAVEIARWDHSGVTGTATTFSQTLTGPQFAAITDLDDLFIEIVANPILTPSEIFGANLVWHVDAALDAFTDFLGTTPAGNTDRVGNWGDQSASGAPATSVNPSNRPYYETAGFNGLPTIFFDQSGGPTALGELNTGAHAVPLLSTSMSIFVVVKVDPAAPDSSRICSFIDGGSTYELDAASCIILTHAAGFYGYSAGTTLGNGGAIVPYTYNVPAVVGLVLDGANANIYLNGVVQGAGVAKTTTMGHSSGNQMFLSTNASRTQARMPEVILVNRAATAPEIASLQAYFASKWGL